MENPNQIIDSIRIEIANLNSQKQKLLDEIDSLEKKVFELKSTGKITLPCQTQRGVDANFHLVMDRNWNVSRVHIMAILDLNYLQRDNQTNVRQLQLNREINLGFARFMLQENQHCIELYDAFSPNTMRFE